jgi:hypothetical protein
MQPKLHAIQSLNRLRHHSVADITVEGLAKELGIAKSGFGISQVAGSCLMPYWITGFTKPLK